MCTNTVFYRDGSDALGSEGKEMGNIVIKLKDVATRVGELLGNQLEDYSLIAFHSAGMYASEENEELNVVRVRGVHCLFSMYLAEDLVYNT